MKQIQEETEIIEDDDIDPEDGEIGFASTLNIDDDPIYENEEEGDSLHPERNVPLVPVSNDSGTLF